MADQDLNQKYRNSLFWKKRNLILGSLAGIVIMITLGSLVFNAMNTRSTDVLTINGKDYEWETIESDFETVEIDGHEGVPVELLIKDAGISTPEGRSFRFTGADGYEKEVPWSDVENGLIDIEEKKVIFPDLAKAFWVRDLVEIEVV